MKLAALRKPRCRISSLSPASFSSLTITSAMASTLVGFTTAYPWGYRDYERYEYVQISTLPARDVTRLVNQPVQAIADLIYAASRGSEYVVFSQAQSAEMEMTGALPVGAVQRIEAAISGSPRYREVYRGRDAQIFRLLGGVG